MISARNVLTIAKKDLRSYFTSPMGHILMAVFSFIMGYMFFAILRIYIAQSAQFGQFGFGKAPSLTDALIRPIFGNMNVVLLFMVPFITARLLAEERRNNTIELLVTAPVRLWDIVLGKFFSALGLVTVLVGLTLPFAVAMEIAASPDWGVIGMAYLGTICMMATFVAIGVWCSSMTDSTLIAGILTFGIFLFLWIIKWISYNSGGTSMMAEIAGYLSVIDHFEDFSRGVLNTRDLFFYVSGTGLLLFLSYKTLESYTWRS